jgi:SAM-dependent methyltransferase
MTGSVRFDRAAEFYDTSRAMSTDAMASTVDLLERELGGRRRVLEVGVGTGLLALPLHGRGVELVGLDLSPPMLGRLVEKAGGRPPFPLVVADATRMPFPDEVFGAAYLRWVLHLIPDWRAALAEVARVVAPGGVFVANMDSFAGERGEIHHRFGEIVGTPLEPVGLAWEAFDELDEAMASSSATARALPTIRGAGTENLGGFVDAIEEGRWSWTWPVPEATRVRAARELRAWAEERFGPLDRPRRYEREMVWRAYDLPGRRG